MIEKQKKPFQEIDLDSMDLEVEEYRLNEMQIQRQNKGKIKQEFYFFFVVVLIIFGFVGFYLYYQEDAKDKPEENPIQMPKDQTQNEQTQSQEQEQGVSKDEAAQERNQNEDVTEDKAMDSRQQAIQKNCTNFCEYLRKCLKNTYEKLTMNTQFQAIRDLYQQSPYKKDKNPPLNLLSQQDYHQSCIDYPKCYELYTYDEILCLPVFMVTYQTLKNKEEIWQHVDIYAPNDQLIGLSNETKYSIATNIAIKQAMKWIQENEEGLIDKLIY